MDQDALQRILNISRHMAETRQLDPLLEYALEEALKLVGGKRGYIVLIRKDGTFDFRAKHDVDGDRLQHPEALISKSILNKTITTGQPVVLGNALSDPAFDTSGSVHELQLRSVLCVPLFSRGTTIGVLYLENRLAIGQFSDDDLLLMTLFANQAAVLIENALLTDELEKRVAARTAELEQAMQHVEKSWLEAVEANRLQTLLFSNVAHDIRSPLALVLSALTLMLEGDFGDLTPEQHDWLEKSIYATQQASNLTNDFFDLTRIRMGKLSLRPEEFDLDAFLHEAYGIGLALPWEPGVKFQLEMPEQLPTLRFDPQRINQVLLNLFSNALKFTHEGNVTLYARVLKDADAVLIGVVDTGEGIPADRLNEIFTRFYQVDDNIERRARGAGLGLAICRELIELHQGTIWVDSVAGSGSDFKFTLPIHPPADEADSEK